MAEKYSAFPYNLEAEQSVLGAMILDKECIPDAIEILKSQDFLQMFSKGKQNACHSKINEQGHSVYDGGDERACHNGRVKAQALGENRQKRTDDLCAYNGCRKG